MTILERFAIDVFKALGIPEPDAKISAKVLITSDLRGIESHGVGRLKFYYDRIKSGQHKTITKIDVIKDSPTTAVLDGNHGIGHVIGVRAMEMAIKKAKTNGLGCVAVRNSTHFGIAGYYVLMAIEAGMIGICCTNARPSVAPTFGVKPMLGTNPLTFGFPTDEAFPFVLDCATSIVQRGKIEWYDRAGLPTPPNLVIGEDGETRTDTKGILNDILKEKAAFLPLGGSGEEYAGYKGFGYSMVVELLSAVLAGGSFLWGLSGINDGKKVPYHLGHWFMAINPEFFTGLETCKKIGGQICREIRNSTRSPGAEHIYTAGEKEYLAEGKVRESGIPFNKGLQAEFNTMQKELNLTKYKFPWQ